MQYPLISEYVRAIQDASSNLDKLAHLVPVLDDHGEPYRSSGAFAVVFKMEDEQTGKCYALKCFTEAIAKHSHGIIVLIVLCNVILHCFTINPIHQKNRKLILLTTAIYEDFFV